MTTRRRLPTIIDMMVDKRLLGSFFEPQESWERWKVLLAATFGLPPPKCRTIDPVEFFMERTGRSEWPTSQAREFWAVKGVRAGKSRIAALIATYLALFRDYNSYLVPGEYGTIPVVAADRRQARVVFGYIRAFLTENSLFAREVVSETQESFTLRNRVRIEIHTASFRAIRGYTCVAGVADEIAVWQSDGANPDAEIITSIRSRFATIPNAMLVGISSPFARAGVLWEMYDKEFGNKGSPDILVSKAATRDMNPSVSEEYVRKRYEEDPARAAAEYGGEFRTDIERYVKLEVVQACTVSNRVQLPAVRDITYRAFVDPSGGLSDAMVLAIGHVHDRLVIVDVLRAFRAPFVPTQVVAQMVALCREYRIHRIHGDRYGGEWPREGFSDAGIEYTLHPKSKSELYVNLLPRLSSGSVELPDIASLANELTSLERRVSPSGREIIDHPKYGHDDHANAVAGLVDLLSNEVVLRPVWGSRFRKRRAA